MIRLFRTALYALAWAIVVSLWVAVLASKNARADDRGGLITEIGGGLALPAPYTSKLAAPSCWAAVPQRNMGTYAAPANGDSGELWACGGHNPVFIGWPIAWEFPNGVRLGVFHLSHWFDGPPFKGDGEIAYTCVCASWTVHWGRR